MHVHINYPEILVSQVQFWLNSLCEAAQKKSHTQVTRREQRLMAIRWQQQKFSLRFSFFAMEVDKSNLKLLLTP